MVDVDFESTTKYHWGNLKEEAEVVGNGFLETIPGPMGFSPAIKLADNQVMRAESGTLQTNIFKLYIQCLVKRNIGKFDKCITNPTFCTDGFSISIYEKVMYDTTIFDRVRTRSKRYVVSTGADYDTSTGILFPGVSIYRRGYDLDGVVVTDTDVWHAHSVGQSLNDTWITVGLTWHRNNGLKVCFAYKL